MLGMIVYNLVSGSDYSIGKGGMGELSRGCIELATPPYPLPPPLSKLI